MGALKNEVGPIVVVDMGMFVCFMDTIVQVVVDKVEGIIEGRSMVEELVVESNVVVMEKDIVVVEISKMTYFQDECFSTFVAKVDLNFE